MTDNNPDIFLALLRGINVGGKGLIKMSDLKTILLESGFNYVQTYIQSGNIIFTSKNSNTDDLAEQIHMAIKNKLDQNVEVVVFSKAQWADIVGSAPAWWGTDTNWKHNLLVLLKPHNMDDAMKAIGNLKPDIESMQLGDGVIYQSMSIKLFGRTTTGKLASSLIYKRMTVRNYNTSTKLLAILDKIAV